MDKNSKKLSEEVKTENLLMFCGLALMAAGPVFWFLMNSALNARLVTLSAEQTGLVDVFDVAIALILAVTGGALALAGWGLSAWHAWQDVKTTEQGRGGLV